MTKTATTWTGVSVSVLLTLLVSSSALAQKGEPAPRVPEVTPISTISADKGEPNAPSPPPFVISTTTTFIDSPGLPITDHTTTTATMTVSGADPYLWDVDLITSIFHTANMDLEITLTSPEGTVVSVSMGNGGLNDDIFSATRFDDQGDIPVSDAIHADGVPTTPVAPEEAFGAFIGEDPNGVWTLDVYDRFAADSGTLSQWRLEVTTLAGPVPAGAPVTVASAPAAPIFDLTTTVVSMPVSGASPYLFDVNLTTNITHTASGDLQITLKSPVGTVVTVTTDNGGFEDNVFSGTFWDDDAGSLNPPGPVTETFFTNGVTETPLVVEEALAAFIGENPNGTWELAVLDAYTGDTGTINSWSLDIRTLDPTLPVELTSFAATVQNGSVLLDWETTSETDNAGFEVQHARGSDEWEELGFVDGAGSSMQERRYEYVVQDLAPGTHRFRLRQLDFDGSFTFSEEIEAIVELPTTHRLSAAYPNPFNPSTAFTLQVARDQHVAIDVFDSMGKWVSTVHSGVLEPNTDHTFRFNATSLPSGAYLLRVIGESFTDSKTVSLVR